MCKLLTCKACYLQGLDKKAKAFKSFFFSILQGTMSYFVATIVISYLNSVTEREREREREKEGEREERGRERRERQRERQRERGRERAYAATR